MSYRIVKRKNNLYQDKDEFVLQTNDLNHHMQNSLSKYLDSTNKWCLVEVFPTLEAAKQKLHYLNTGLNPGEEVVG